MERNFLRDQSGMREQLVALNHLALFMDPKLYQHLQSADSTNFFFFFRMLLVWYKREFSWVDILRLWEVLWTDYLSSGFHLFVALAILEKHRDVIMTHLKHFDEVLKYVNELSNTMDLTSTLIRAEALFRRFQRLVSTIDKRQNFPPPRFIRKPPTTTTTASPGASVISLSSSTSSTVSIPPSFPSRVASTSPRMDGGEATENQAAETAAAETPMLRKDISPELRKLLSRDFAVLTADQRESHSIHLEK